MKLYNIVPEIKSVLKSSKKMIGAKIISGFPAGNKPTKIENVVISLGIERVDFEPAEIEDSTRTGQVSIYADIYAPAKLKGDISYRVLCILCDSLKDYNIISISAQKMEYQKDIQAFVTKTVITFSDKFTFGGT
ncbi:MAG: hypothetical protein NC119_00120 [Clostridiales bacterium]|nr:hypothetical protein [Clostridiales bacterium]